MKSLLEKTEAFYERHERHISSFALIAGFIFDNLTVQRIDLPFDHIIIIAYLVISGGSIALINYYKEHPPQKDFSVGLENFLPSLIQFAFGGLFSVFFVFYVRSATLSSSWPFLVMLLVLLVGNEFFRNYYQRLTFQVAVYYIAIFSFSILITPVLLKKINAGVFLLSGLLSIIFLYFFTRILFIVVSKRYESSRVDINRLVAVIFLVVNILYFTNLIPPIPLAMKNSGAYHSVAKVGDNYVVVSERGRWYESLPFIFPKVLHFRAGESVYAFSAIFAPTDLSTGIIHDWQYFDTVTDKWVSTTKVAFDIHGGRGEGYRIFSKKDNVFSGKWRVDVKTKSGQIIGRIRFNVELGLGSVVLIESSI